MIVVPPLKAGAVQVTIAEALPAKAATFVGGVGIGNRAVPVSQRSPGSLGHGSAPAAPHQPQGSTAVHEEVTYTPKWR